MAKPKIAPKPPAGEKIPLSRIHVTWTPPRIYENDEPKPVTIGGERLAWLLRSEGAREPGKHWAVSDELGLLTLRLNGLSQLLGAFSDVVGKDYDDQAILFFLQGAASALVRDVQHIDPLDVNGLMKSATVTIADEPKAAVA